TPVGREECRLLEPALECRGTDSGCISSLLKGRFREQGGDRLLLFAGQLLSVPVVHLGSSGFISQAFGLAPTSLGASEVPGRPTMLVIMPVYDSCPARGYDALPIHPPRPPGVAEFVQVFCFPAMTRFKAASQGSFGWRASSAST